MYPGFTDYSAPQQGNSPILNAPTGENTPSYSANATPTGAGGLNYTNNTNEYLRLLSATERRELEVPRELYVNIKLLEVLEKAFTFEKVPSSEYQMRTENILNKIERLTQILQQKNPNMTLDIFMQDYGLTDCTWATQRIKKGRNKETGTSVHGLVASVTSGFIRLPDYFFMNADNPQVKDLLPMLQEMKQLLDMLKPHFSKPGHPFNLSDRYGPLIVKLSAMGLNDKLSQEFVNEILDVNEFAKNTFQIYLR